MKLVDWHAHRKHSDRSGFGTIKTTCRPICWQVMPEQKSEIQVRQKLHGNVHHFCTVVSSRPRTKARDARVYSLLCPHRSGTRRVRRGGGQSPVPAVVISHRAGDLLELHVLVPVLNRPVVVRRDVPAGAAGKPGRWTPNVPPKFLAASPPQRATVGNDGGLIVKPLDQQQR